MSTPKFEVFSKVAAPKNNNAVVLAVIPDGKKVKVQGWENFPDELLNLDAVGAKVTFEHCVRVASKAGGVFLLIGAGTKPHDADSLRRLAGAATRALHGISKITFALPTESPEQSVAILEGAGLASYRFEKFKSKQSNDAHVETIAIATPHKPKPSALEDLGIVISAANQIRDLVNSPPNHIYPQTLAAEISKSAKGAPVTVTVLAQKELREQKLAGILAVGQGSVHPPRLIKIEYKPKGAKNHLALVGKGITFDSGGLSIKPRTGMLGMKYDMTGAATIGHAVLAIARMGLKVRVTGYMCVAENLPSGTASRPNDVIRYRNGKTVEITNTDAEGRLVLADGLILASEQKPDLIIDVATLTGAAKAALGTRYSALMGNESGVTRVCDAAAQTGELVWPMPMPEELKANLRSEVADMINSNMSDPNGGMLVAAHFLSEFVGNKGKDSEEQLAWAHLDIAGTAKNDGAPYGHDGKGATAVMLRTLIQSARDLV